MLYIQQRIGCTRIWKEIYGATMYCVSSTPTLADNSITHWTAGLHKNRSSEQKFMTRLYVNEVSTEKYVD